VFEKACELKHSNLRKMFSENGSLDCQQTESTPESFLKKIFSAPCFHLFLEVFYILEFEWQRIRRPNSYPP